MFGGEQGVRAGVEGVNVLSERSRVNFWGDGMRWSFVDFWMEMVKINRNKRLKKDNS